ncbi:hypothetical protein MELA_01373 [Candidatus Methylomirabilis lanthanidiphila]|uniref:Uncharacterized protein n=1 Tax=Candidatus Methylomirabilis lanthanidiphila TaxID=2211376 RepID=A0A564ZKB9_9BACT|nr:hypothetical protein MELA_01373 [Candidatus Methylomirabilis lanthanidiphila]
MKCCETNKGKVTQEERRTKLSGLAGLGIVGTILTCVACFTPLAVTLLGVIGLADGPGILTTRSSQSWPCVSGWCCSDLPAADQMMAS